MQPSFVVSVNHSSYYQDTVCAQCKLTAQTFTCWLSIPALLTSNWNPTQNAIERRLRHDCIMHRIPVPVTTNMKRSVAAVICYGLKQTLRDRVESYSVVVWSSRGEFPWVTTWRLQWSERIEVRMCVCVRAREGWVVMGCEVWGCEVVRVREEWVMMGVRMWSSESVR